MPRKRFGPRYRVSFRRRREGRTDYYARYRLVISGKIRAVVRKSRRNVIIHFTMAELQGDKTLVFTRSSELKKYGWTFSCRNTPAAYLTGYLAGLKALKAGIKEAILDIGPQRASRGSILFASLKGLVDAGVEIPYNEEILPSNRRILGYHIAEFYEKVLQDREKYENQFTEYINKGFDATKITEIFNNVLQKIAEEFKVEPPKIELEENFEEDE